MIAGRRPTQYRLIAFLLATTALGGCNALERLSEVGSEPTLSAVEDPTQKHEYKKVSMPMPNPVLAQPSPNSLWRPGARAFFKDQRAGEIGDILTVIVDITNDQAQLANTSTRARGPNTETAGMPNILGFESKLNKILPNAVNPANLVDLTSASASTGTGSINRSEVIKLRLAAVITQVLPNGNFVVAGRQEIRVNYEMRELTVTGVIRSQDIASDNSINWDKIAEARISYGGRGTVSDVQQARYGQQIFDIIFPF
ncbi:MAG: flagellar basal body L-ring protein FlgH [Alphaproteobacteria bacterium]|nr:flagellar basal body L-ring protein FlgH [Alphaproteobacteria bacterium]